MQREMVWIIHRDSKCCSTFAYGGRDCGSHPALGNESPVGWGQSSDLQKHAALSQRELCYVGKKQAFHSKMRLFIASRLTGLGQAGPDREGSQGNRGEDKAGTES